MSAILRTEIVECDGQRIEVRELKAPDFLRFLKVLSGYTSAITSDPRNPGQTQIQLAQLVAGAVDLAEFLVLRSCGKDAAWLEQLSPVGFVDALDASIRLNITEELVKKVQGVVVKLMERMGSTTPRDTSASVSTS